MDRNPKYLDPLHGLDPDEMADIIREHAYQLPIDSEYEKAQAAQPDHHPVLFKGVFNTQPVLRAHAKKRRKGKLQRQARRNNRK